MKTKGQRELAFALGGSAEVERPGWLARTVSPRYRFGVLVRAIARAALLAASFGQIHLAS